MKKFILPALLLTFMCTQARAQTKRIAHRSHSGAASTFSLTKGSDNFGNPPENYERFNLVPIDTAKAATEGGTIKKDKAKKQERRRKNLKSNKRVK